MPVITGAMGYPDNILEKINALGASVVPVNALELALEAGSSKAVNVVLIGLLSSMMDLPYELWQEAMEKTVKPKF